MRILMISDVFFPRINGVSTSMLTFARELQSQGHELTILAPDYGGVVDTRLETGLEVQRIASREVILDPEDRMMRIGCALKNMDDYKQRCFDLIHIQTPFVAHYLGLKLARILNLPVVETYHTFFEEYLYHYIRFMPRSFMRFFARRFSVSQCNAVDYVIAPSAPINHALREYGVTQPMSVIPTGLDSTRFVRGDGPGFKKAYGIDPQRPVLLFVGRLAHEKNIGFLLDMLPYVLESMPEVLLILAGEGPAIASLRARITRNGLQDNVMFVGYLDRAGALQDCYCAADVFVFASRTETQGLVLLEAMALGVPVVSTAVLGTKTVLVQGQGADIAEDDCHDFSAKVIALLQDDDRRKALAISAIDYASTWSIEFMTKNLLDVYQCVIESSLEMKNAMHSSAQKS